MPKKTLNKSDIIEEIATIFELPKSRAEKIVNALFNEICTKSSFTHNNVL